MEEKLAINSKRFMDQLRRAMALAPFNASTACTIQPEPTQNPRGLGNKTLQ
jgi:hypothetical protein